MSSFGRKAAELIKEVATSDTSTLPPYNEVTVAAVKDEANEHYQALLNMLGIIHAAGPSDAASPEAAANVLVHNRALLRNKRLMLAYVCVSGARARPQPAPCASSRLLTCPARAQQRAHGPNKGAALDGRRRAAGGG